MTSYENERAGEVQRTNRAALRGSYDYIIVGAGASGSIITGELSKTGADVLVVESGGEDAGPTISNPSIGLTMLAVLSTGRCQSRQCLP